MTGQVIGVNGGRNIWIHILGIEPDEKHGSTRRTACVDHPGALLLHPRMAGQRRRHLGQHGHPSSGPALRSLLGENTAPHHHRGRWGVVV